MSIIKNKNFSKGFLSKLSGMNIQNNDTFLGCNFSQTVPHTKVLDGFTGLTFQKCNLINCDVPIDSIIDDCSHYKRYVEYCTNLHPTKVNGVPCSENCSHVTETDNIIIDSVPIATIYKYEDKEVS